MFFKKRKVWEVIFLFILSLTPLIWFSDGHVVIGHDSGFRFKNLNFIKELFYSWNPNVGFGLDLTVFKGFLLLQLPETFFTWLFKSLSVGEMITFVVWFFLIGISMYIFTNSFFPQKNFWVFRLFASTFYMFNFFILQGWFIAERAKFSLFAALPLGLLIFYKTLNKDYPVLKGSIFFSFLFLFLNGGSSPPLYGSILLVLFLTVIFQLILNFFTSSKISIKYILKVSICFLIFSGLLNAYWVLPQLYLLKSGYSSSLGSHGGIEGILGWESVVSKYASLSNLLRLQGIPDWYENINHSYSNFFINNWIFIFFSYIPILIISSGFYFFNKLIIDKPHQKIIFLITFIFLISILFTAGSHPPFGVIYIFFLKYVPGFAIFRSAFYKFGPAYWFTFIFLSGLFLNLILNKFIKKEKLFFIIGSLSVFFVLFYHFPYFQGGFFNWNKPFTTKVKVPSYVAEMSDYINKNTLPESRILLLPSIESDPPKADSYDWGYWSLDVLPILSLDRPVVSNVSDSPLIINELYDFIKRNDIENYKFSSSILGINNILWRGDVLYSDKISTSISLYPIYDRFINFKKPDKVEEIGKWELYDNGNVHPNPIIYTSSSIIYSDKEANPVQSLRLLNRSKFDVVLNLEKELDVDRERLTKISVGEVVQAECVFCDKNLLWDLQLNKYLPPGRFIPGSIFYSFVEDKEKRILKSVKDLPDKKIDALLGFSTDRLRELSTIINLGFSAKKNESYLLMDKYKSSLQDAVLLLETLPEEQRNYYKIKILTYLQMNYNFLGSLNPGDYRQDDKFEYLIDFIQSQSQKIKSDVWMTSSQREVKYLLNIKNDGNYKIDIAKKYMSPQAIYINNNLLDPQSEIYLKKGVYKILLDYGNLENYLGEGDIIPGKVYKLTYRKKIRSEIKNFDRLSKYIFRFGYENIQGKNPYFSIDQYDIRGKKIKLENNLIFQLDSINNDFYYSFTPHPSVKKVFATFFTDSKIDELSNFSIKDFSVNKLDMPNVIFARNIDRPKISMPKIQYKKINPTLYIVDIRDSKGEFILNFNQNFSSAWKIYAANNSSEKSSYLDILKSREPIRSMHFRSNTYANSWMIDKKGDFSIVIEYFPQRFVYFGIAVSIASMVVFIIIYFKKIYVKK